MRGGGGCVYLPKLEKVEGLETSGSVLRVWCPACVYFGLVSGAGSVAPSTHGFSEESTPVPGGLSVISSGRRA